MDSLSTYQEQTSSVTTEASNSKSELVQKIKTSLYKQERDRLWKIIKQVRQSSSREAFFGNIVKVVRQEFSADRVLIYRFDTNDTGKVIAEALVAGWTPAMNETLSCNCFGAFKAADFQTQGYVTIEHPNSERVTPYQKQLLEKFQTQASLALPILLDSGDRNNATQLDRTWGLLVVQQCQQPRSWHEDEINLLYQLTVEITRVLQSSTNYLEADGKDLAAATTQFLEETLQEIRQTLKGERVWIYGFNPDGSGRIVVESKKEKLPQAGSIFDYDDTITTKNCRSEYVVNNIYTQGFPRCLVASLETIQARSYIAVPIKAGDRLVGLLAIFQSTSRNWQKSEVELMQRYSAKMAYPVQQVNLIHDSQFKAKQLKVLESPDVVGAISLQTTQFMEHKLGQIRGFLKADRVLVYGFNPDGSGEIIAESVDSAWKKASNSFDNDCFITPDNCKDKYVANDIYDQDIATCFIEQIESLEAKAYIIVPIKSGSRLLGMLGVYQNSATRNWQESEVELVMEYAPEFSLPLEQTSDLRNLKFKAKQAELISDRDFLNSINQNAEQMMQGWADKIRASMKVDRVAVFAFNQDWSGRILAESKGEKWKPVGSTLDYDFHFKGGEFKPYYVANDIQTKGLARCIVERFDEIEAKAYIIVPIHANNQLMGLLAVYQNSAPRSWQESEITQVREYAARFIKPLQQTAYFRNAEFQNKQMERAFKREKSLSKSLEKLRLSKSEQAVWQIATDQGREILDVDRVAIYRFNPDWSGNFVADSIAPGGTSLLKIIPFIEDTFLQNTKGGRYKLGETFAVEDIYTQGHKECHVELLEQMQARAYALAPIFVADSDMFGSKRLWGLIGCYQNDKARRWQEFEVETLRQLGLQIGVAMQQIDYTTTLKRQSELDKTSSKISEKIRKASNLDEVFEITTQEVNRALEVDRTIVYQFNEDFTGQVVAETVAGDWVSLLVAQEKDGDISSSRTENARCVLRKWSSKDITETDTYLEKTQGGKYISEGKKYTIVNDIYDQKFSDCYIKSLEKYQAKAYIIAPIFQDEKLWGLLGVYQNSSTRNWQDMEAEQIVQLASQLGIAIRQIEYISTLQKQSELDKTSRKIGEQIRKARNIDEVFEITTQEVNRALEVDRTIVYQFNEDFTGQVVAETVAGDWVSLLVAQKKDGDISSSRRENARCVLRKWATDDITETDTYMEKTKGGRYTSQGKKYTVVNDIYTQDFPNCYIESLERYQAKAYIIAPIFQDEKLWGLLGVYQNSGTRNWQQMEVDQIAQFANQLGIAIQQIDYYDQLLIQSKNLAETVAREKAAREELQKQALDILTTVRPAFSGDLTVRAKVTETEIGTVAGAYNTTLDSLKDIVEQVQNAASQVTETTGSSSNAIKGLSLQSERQLTELQEALDRVQAMIDASTVTTENARKVERAIEQANQTVQTGDRAMNNTVDSIVSIRDTVADAGKRVKRLSDSSQKISKVVSLIGSFATQTNLLALNAALEATRAGEYGKGFAVVADEVRNLSLQSSEATTEIEKLVREIQQETQEVAAAMEAGVEQVAQGTNLVNETRQSLNEIVIATAEIKDLVEGITSAANVQTQEAASVTHVMGQVAEIANETSQDSGKISVSFEQLEQLAQKLQASVSRFKVK